jgi:acyl dehydratase
MRPDAEGIVYPTVPFVVDAERVRAFADVVDPGRSGSVPPTFPTVAEFAVFPEVIADPRVGLDLARVLHGSQEYDYERPLRAGETLHATTRIGSVRVRGEAGFLTLVTEIRDDEGRLVVTGRCALIERAET